MKKIVAIVCVLTLVLTLAACSSKDEAENPEDLDPEITEPETSTNPVEDMELADIMAEMIANVVNLPGVGNVELTSENFASFAFIDYVEGMEGLVSEAMIGSMAHSAVLVRVAEDMDAEAIADEIRDSADPRKWICVEAEKTEVLTNGNLILLVMSSTVSTDQIAENFNAL